MIDITISTSERRSGTKRFFTKLARRSIAVSLIICGLFFLIDIRIRPVIEKTAEYQSRLLAVRIINSAVYNEISAENFQYDNLINLCYDDEGHISSIETNMVNVNKLKTMSAKIINDEIDNINEYDLNISLGTVSGIKMLYGKGPSIPFYAEPCGYVDTSLISSFEEAGINQTLHRIIMHIETVISAIIPGYTSEISIKTDFVIAETVIVGEVPNSYTHVITGNDDVISSINDYGG